VPTYQYVCTECATPLEVVQSFTDQALVECPTCGGRLRKVFSAVGVVFKGSGFYRTDSREKAAVGTIPKSAGESSAAESSKSSDGKTSSTDSKTSSTDTSTAKPAKAAAPPPAPAG
jgi:putative FmdB family regulatory protein